MSTAIPFPDTDTDSNSDMLGDWSDDSSAKSENSPDVPILDSSKEPEALFATPKIQSSVHIMLTHLQEWWEHSEQLLQVMADKKLPCNTLRQMSDDIDTMLDKAISNLIETVSSDPSVFPVAALISTTRAIKKYLFLKVGEVCCQAGNEDKCAKMANVALTSLKKFRTSATDFYDQLLAHMIESMDQLDKQPDVDEFTTPDIKNLLDALTTKSDTQKTPDVQTKPKRKESKKTSPNKGLGIGKAAMAA